jgi:hypothetical protein
MSPNYYADGVLETLKNIENAITTLKQVVSKSPELTSLYRLRNELQEKVKAFVGTLGLLQSMPNSGVGVWIINEQTNKYYQYLRTELFRRDTFVFFVRPDGEYNVIHSAFDKHYRLATPSEVEQHEAFLLKKHGQTSFVNGRQPLTVPVNEINNLKNLVTIKRVDKPSIDPSKCEFYMVTCTGEKGSKVRHLDYKDAEKEAMRVASMKNHSAWVVGVVAKIEPEVKTTFNVKKSW